MKADGEMFTPEIDGPIVLIGEICLHAIDVSQGHWQVY